MLEPHQFTHILHLVGARLDVIDENVHTPAFWAPSKTTTTTKIAQTRTVHVVQVRGGWVNHLGCSMNSRLATSLALFFSLSILTPKVHDGCTLSQANPKLNLAALMYSACMWCKACHLIYTDDGAPRSKGHFSDKAEGQITRLHHGP